MPGSVPLIALKMVVAGFFGLDLKFFQFRVWQTDRRSTHLPKEAPELNRIRNHLCGHAVL